MKSTRVILALITVMAAAAIASAQTITMYGVVKIYDLTQTSTSAPSGGATPYGFTAFVDGTGLSGTYSFTKPGGSAQSLLIEGGSSANYEDAFAYADPTAVNTAYNNGSYSMAIPNTNGAAQSVTGLNLSSDIYPNVFQVTGGSWVDNKLQINPASAYTLNFSPYTLSSGSFGTGDRIELSIESANFNTTSTSAVTSFEIPAATLTAGLTYSAELVFINVVYVDTTTISGGATGIAAYATIVSFDIQAIPEPSTYAAMFGVVALAGVMIHRRRRTT